LGFARRAHGYRMAGGVGSNGAEVRSDEFPSTRWSLVVRAGSKGGGDAGPVAEQARRDALAHLLRLYLPALRVHLVARRLPGDRVDDLLQGFVADKVIERNLLAAADQARGRFRGFLATALDHFVANQFRHDAAHKRAPQGGARVLAWDPDAGLEPVAPNDGADPDAFDLAWAREALAEAVRRMRDQCVATGQADLWDVLEVRVLAPALDAAEPLPYSELVRRFGYATPKQAANALVTAKRRLEHALRSVLAEYTADEDELERELAGLGRALAAAPHGWSGNDAGFGSDLREAARGAPTGQTDSGAGADTTAGPGTSG
jgi:hypothetical protein